VSILNPDAALAPKVEPSAKYQKGDTSGTASAKEEVVATAISVATTIPVAESLAVLTVTLSELTAELVTVSAVTFALPVPVSDDMSRGLWDGSKVSLAFEGKYSFGGYVSRRHRY